MKKMVEVPLESGDVVLVQMNIEENTKAEAAAVPGELIKASQTMESALETITPTVAAMLNQLLSLPRMPDETTLEFGLGLSFDSSGILKMLVSTGAEATFKVSFTWKK